MEKTKCVIYCRVSSDRQVKEGNGNQSQEKRCRDFAKNKDYQVVEVFPDEGVSGGLFERPAMRRLIDYLDAHPFDKFVIIFDDLSRFARDLSVHLRLKTELKSRGAKFECLNFNFEDSPEGEFIENVIASKAQLDRQQNKRQVIQKQKARMELGYWSLIPPRALVNQKDPIHGRLLVSNEPYARIYKKAIEAFAEGSLLTIEEVKHFINREYELLGLKKRISFHAARLALTQILYAGYIEYPHWNVSRRKAHHSGFITIETYDKVQEKLNGNKKHGIRKDYNPDFPLRQMLECIKCHGAISGSWNKGRNKHYANYACVKPGCPYRYKVIRKDKIEPEFEALLVEKKPRSEVLDLVTDVLKDVWTQRKTFKSVIVEKNKDRLKEIDEMISNTGARISKASSEDLVIYYEGELKKLLTEKKDLGTKDFGKYTDEEFGTATDIVFTALKKPLDMWKSDKKEDKRTIFNMYFAKKLPYDIKQGFGTVTFDPTIGLIQASYGIKTHLVETEGIEPSSVKAYLQNFIYKLG